MDSRPDNTHTHIWLEAWQGGWALLPIAAVLGGAWAFSGPFTPAQLPTLALKVALVLAGWLPLWRAITGAAWRRPLQRWRTWETIAPLPRWPYLEAQTPGGALYRALGRARAWWQAEGAQALAVPLRAAMLALGLSLLLSLALGRAALLLSILLLTWAQLAALWDEGNGTPGLLWEALAIGGLPWLLGASLQDEFPTLALLSALLVTLLVACYARASYLALCGPALAGGFLLWQGQALATGLLLLLAFPGLFYLAHGLPQREYRRVIAGWLLLMLLLIAGVL